MELQVGICLFDPIYILLSYLLKVSCIKVHRIIEKLQVVKSGLPSGATFHQVLMLHRLQKYRMDIDGVSEAGNAVMLVNYGEFTSPHV